MRDASQHEKSLFRAMVFGTALSFGSLAAIIVSMKDFIGGNAVFEFSYKTILAFVLGSLAGWLFWWFVRRRARKAPDNRHP